MDPIIGGAIISGIGNVVGNLFGNSQAKRQERLQKEFAQNGIKWRVEDAKRSGIHPLYALGAQVTPYSPVSVGDGGFSAMGQDLSRAYMATRTEEEKVDVMAQQLQAAQLRNVDASTRLLEAQTIRTLRPENPAPFPGSSYMISGQPSSGLVVDQPMQRDASIVSGTDNGFSVSGNIEPGSHPDAGYLNIGDGFAVVPGDVAKERIEDDFLQQVIWAWRNQLYPLLDSSARKPPYRAPLGSHWEFNGTRYKLVKTRRQGGGGVKGY